MQHAPRVVCCYHLLSTYWTTVIAIEKLQATYNILSARCAITICSRLNRRTCWPLRDSGSNIKVSTVGLLVLFGMDTETAVSATERAKESRENTSDQDACIIYCGHEEYHFWPARHHRLSESHCSRLEVTHKIHITVSKIMF